VPVGRLAVVRTVTRVDAMWLAVEPVDLRAGTRWRWRTSWPCSAPPSRMTYLFANKRANRTKLLVHDGMFGHTRAVSFREQPSSQVRRFRQVTVSTSSARR